ncbi:Serine/threonine-protein kinase [Salix suchowensis]|nr:Serine/threonine-protein kinase [Salix suchowensis]
MSSKHRNNNSICEKSMNMVVNIIRLSSFSIATMSLDHLPLMTQIPGSRRSQESHGSSKPISFVMQPDEGNGSSRVIHKENSFIDERASDYIRRVHEKNRKDALEASKHSPHIPPPPPRAVK